MKPKSAAAPTPNTSAGLRRFLFLTAAITGAIVLIVEILGAKMLAPYLGTSHFVWTAQIGITLLSLATGYWFGGWLVERSQKLSRLYFCILGAAVYLSGTILFKESVAYACLGFSLPVGSVFASFFLFFVPLTLLAAVGPFLIRVLSQSVQGVGGLAGRLSAISTLGSVLGTVLIGYVLIPLLPNSVTMFISATILVLLAVIYFAVWGRKNSSLLEPAIGVIAFLLLGTLGVMADSQRNFEDSDEVLRKNSDFGQIQVLRNRETGYLVYLNDFLTQNSYDPENKRSMYLFTYMLHGLAQVYREPLHDVLCIGMGVGIVPMQFAHDGCQVDVVEINPTIIPVAEKYFDLDASKLNITVGDGRQYLNVGTKTYDAIILDAFLGDSSPSHLMTREAFSAIKHRLKPGGVLVINSFGDFRPDRDFFTASLNKTLKAVFPSVRIHHSRDDTGNVFFVASDAKNLNPLHELKLTNVAPRIESEADSAMENSEEPNPEHGMVLTDDYNPVDFYDAANREELRRNLAYNMRKR